MRLNILFPIVPNRLFSGRTKNNRHFRYPETKITDFKISGTRLGTTLRLGRLILETETEPGTKSRFHYLCLDVRLRFVGFNFGHAQFLYLFDTVIFILSY